MPLMVNNTSPSSSAASSPRARCWRRSRRSRTWKKDKGSYIRIAQVDGLTDDAEVGEHVVVLNDVEHHPAGAVVLLADAGEDALADGRVLHQPHVLGRDAHVRFGQGHLQIVNQGLEERPMPVHAAQGLKGFGPSLQSAVSE